MKAPKRQNSTKTILVVDDDEGILDALDVMLEMAGYNVTLSATGSHLKSLTKNNAPNLILLDVLLSGTDGRQLCKELKNNQETKQIPVIMLSAAPDVEKSIKAANADAFIAKPFEMDELMNVIQKHIT